MPQLPELAQLQLFLSVAQAGSLSRAASLVGTTPSALSKRISALELGLGHRLFLRNGRGVVLTDAGRALIGPARGLVEDASRLHAQVEHGADSPAGTVTLGLQASLSWPLMQVLWRRVRAEAPAIRLRVYEAPTRQLFEDLRQSRIDLAVLSEWGSERLETAILLHATRLHLVGAAGQRHTSGGSVPFRLLSRLPLILSAMSNGARAWLEQLARDGGMTLDVVIEAHSLHLGLKMVQAGWGFTVAPWHAIAEEVAAGRLSSCPVTEPALALKFYLASASARPPSVAVALIAQWIRAWKPDERTGPEICDAPPRAHASRSPPRRVRRA